MDLPSPKVNKVGIRSFMTLEILGCFSKQLDKA